MLLERPGTRRDPGATGPPEGESPPRAGAILTVLILGAVVANINLAIANVALPSIGAALDTSQAELNLVAVGFTLGLAASVLYLGALADRYGRKPAMMLGAALSIPASLLAAWAPNATVLIVARVSGGVAAGLLYPITLSLITGLFREGRAPARSRCGRASGVAARPWAPWSVGCCWAASGGGRCSALRADRGAGGRAGRPVAAPARGGVQRAVDHLGGVLSVVFIGPLVLAISLVPNYGFNGTVLGLFAVSLVGLVLFVVRERRASSPCSTSRCCAPGPSPSRWSAARSPGVACSAPPSSASSTPRTCWATRRCRRR